MTRGGLEITLVEEYQLITASAWSNKAQAATGGVGLVLNKEAQKTIIRATWTSNRVILASFKSNPILSIVVAYAPTLDATNEEKEHFYSDLRHAVETVPVHNFLTILGDFNARLGGCYIHLSSGKNKRQWGVAAGTDGGLHPPLK